MVSNIETLERHSNYLKQSKDILLKSRGYAADYWLKRSKRKDKPCCGLRDAEVILQGRSDASSDVQCLVNYFKQQQENSNDK